MLTDEMQALIVNFSAGAVAKVNADGTPSVSPKATFVVLEARSLAFGNLRSPGTLANLRRNPAIEVCFTDIVTRRAVRVTGTATIVRRADADAALDAAFDGAWGRGPPLCGVRGLSPKVSPSCAFSRESPVQPRNRPRPGFSARAESPVGSRSCRKGIRLAQMAGEPVIGYPNRFIQHFPGELRRWTL